ncbi:hypothetical protein ATY36_19980 [Vibrio cidicii]|uniref:MFS transporter n=1 Tax=Vibrio cidicii TaxID=1763883 RepID=UPI0007800177|nr:glycoside-pentoside-hexuronide (GPH):cation symporter [Vibrio cidicii]KYN79810.1 hypothetical protein ATY36_19980 [Vibrio cidicii]
MKTISVSNKVGYALGDLANSLTFGMSSMFLLAYYTDVLGISAAAAGTLFLVARVWDAINDPMMGALCDKLFAKRRGEKFRPFLLKGSWPVIIAAILVFWAPEGLTDVQKLIWAYVTYIVFGMAYTFINIPYGSLATVMTNDPAERAGLSGARAFGSMMGMVSCNMIMPFLLSFFADDLSKAYLYGVTALGLVSFICYLFAYRMTEEHIKHELTDNPDFGFKDTIKTLGKNVPFLCVSVASMLMLTAMLGQGSVLYYYLSLNLDGALWFISLTAVVQVVTTIVVAPSVGKLSARFGTRKLMLIGFAGAGIASMVSFVLPTSIYGAMVFYIVGMPFMLLPNILIWANVADCIDYNYEISGQRQEGIIYSSYSFMRKMGQAIAGFIAGMGLSMVGYNAALDVQADATLMGIKAFMFAMPSIAMAGCFVLYYFFWNLEPKSEEPNEKPKEADAQIA